MPQPRFHGGGLRAGLQPLPGCAARDLAEAGTAGDDTHGHVDDVARFVAPDTIVCAVCRDPVDPNYGPLAENLRILRAARDPAGHPFRVVELPMAPPDDSADETLPASYANFLICGDSVIVPTFGVETDAAALETLGRAAGRRPAGLYSNDLIEGGGSVHCLTHQIAAV